MKRESRPTSPSDCTQALDCLVELYFDTDKPDELAKWQAERAKYAK